MAVNFVTIKSTGDSGYQVTRMTFPQVLGNRVILSVSKSSIEQCANKATAEIAAIKFADLQHFVYVPENTSVITSIPFGESGFLAMELTSDGKVLGQGSVVNRARSVAQATEIAQRRQLPLVLPQ